MLDLTTALSGPFASLLLAGLGARVIKVENPNAADNIRTQSPYLGRDGARIARRDAEDISLAHLNRNRNKEAISLDLKSPRGIEVFADLVRKADVVIENFSAGTMERLGIGWSFLEKTNPRVIYAAISGFGAGSNPGAGAMDGVIQALSGIMMTSGETDDPPIRVGVPMGDTVAPLFCVIGILAAAAERERSGRGQHVDVSMLGALTALVSTEPFDVLETAGSPMRSGRFVPRLMPSGVFQTMDGHVAIYASHEAFVRALFGVIGLPELISDPRFKSRDLRVQNAKELAALIDSWSRSVTTAEGLMRLTAAGVPCGMVRSPKEAIRDPLVLARGETVPLEHPFFGRVGDVVGTGIPIRFSRTPAALDRPPPGFGEHNDAVYRTLLGYSEDQLLKLRAAKVI